MPSVDEDLPLVGIINAGDHIHQRRFSATVLTQHGKNLALVYGEINVPVCGKRAEIFGNLSRFQRNSLIHAVTSKNKFETSRKEDVGSAPAASLWLVVHL